jgi:hypothetical protein
MAYPTDYSGWVDFVRNYLDVDDFDNDRVGGFLSLAQTRLNRELNSQWMEKDAQLTIVNSTGGVHILPTVTDYNRVRLVSPVVGDLPLDVLAFNEYKKYVASNSAAGQTPTHYSIEGQKLYVYPLPAVGDVFDFYYYVFVPEIASGSQETNIFTDHHPDMLLYASCLEGSRFIVEDERIPTWNSAYNQGLDSSNGVAKNAKMGSTPLKRNITLYRVK